MLSTPSGNTVILCPYQSQSVYEAIRTLNVIYDNSSVIDFGVKWGYSLATILIQLNGWTSNSAIATKDATVS